MYGLHSQPLLLVWTPNQKLSVIVFDHIINVLLLDVAAGLVPQVAMGVMTAFGFSVLSLMSTSCLECFLS
jgi:hypothetical protein